MKNVSLHAHLLLACIIPTSILMTVFAVFVILFRFQDIDNLEQETAQTLLSKYYLAFNNQPLAQWQMVANSALDEKYLRSLDIFDMQGKKVIHAGPNSGLNSLNVKQLMNLKQKQSYIPYSNGAIFVKEITLNNDHNQQIYWLAIEIQSVLFNVSRYQSVIGITIITVGFLIVLLLWLSGNIRHRLNPLHQMIEQLQHLTPQQSEKLLHTHAISDLYILENRINQLLILFFNEYHELKQTTEQAKSDLEENVITLEAHNIELRLARNAAIEGNKTKSAFLANISHELRTPLNSIKGFTQLLLKMPLTHKQHDWVETIEKSSNNLLSIINDVLDFSKIEAGKFSLQIYPFILENAVFEVLESLAPQAEIKGLEQVAFIYEEVPYSIKGDVLRFKQILTNLVSNAIRFTEKGEIVVRVMLEDTRLGQHIIRISVSDTGKGLSAHEKKNLFTAFQQGNPTLSREAGGTGLGLVIAKSLVKLMEGDIGFDDEQIQGATFWFNFKAEIDESTKTNQTLLLTGKHVLLLESHEKNSQLIRSTLFNAHAEVKVVKTWLDLLNSLSDIYQIIMLDSRNLDKDCYSQLSLLRQRFNGMIVLLTGLNDIQSLPESTFDELSIYTLSKPIRPIQLLHLLGQGISTAKLKKHLPTVPNNYTTTPLHILAVDDHPLNLKLVCTLLDDLGINVSRAENGKQAVELCQQHKYDLILMDIQMPEMDGLQATQLIRQHEHLNASKKTPIVALTAHALADEQENIRQCGMNDYLTKPLEESQLIHIIQRWTGIQLDQTQIVSNHKSSPKLTKLALLDWDDCLRLSAGKRDLALDIINMLIESIPTSEEKITQSWQKYNLPALLAHIHYLHGATRYCGVPILRQSTKDLETQLKEAIKYNTSNEDHVKRQLQEQVSMLLMQLAELKNVDLKEFIH